MTSLPFYYTDFHGGLNTRDAPYLVTDDQARDLQNVQGTTAGAIVKRTGLFPFCTGLQPGSLFAYEGSPPYLIAADSHALFAINQLGVPNQICSGLSDTAHWSFVQSQQVAGSGPVYGMNGFDPPQQWSGAGRTSPWVATSGTIPNGQYMILAGNRIWVAGVPNAPGRVFFSDLIPVNNGPMTWPAANVAVFDENDGQPITGLGQVGPYILVTKARKLYVITDMNTGDGRRLSDGIGAVSHRSIAAAPEGTYFLSEGRGVYRTNGSTLTPISDQIQPTIDTIQDRSKAVAIYFNGHYYLSVTLGNQVTKITLDYDTMLNSWWKHTIPSNQFVVWHPNRDAELYSADAGNLFVVRCFTPNFYTDYGLGGYTWFWTGPWQSPTFYRRRRFPTPYFKKNFRQIRVDGYGQVDLSVAYDFATNAIVKSQGIFNSTDSFGLGTDTFGGAGTGTFGRGAITPARFFSFGVHTAVSIQFGRTSSDTPDAVFSYVLMISDRKDMVVS